MAGVARGARGEPALRRSSMAGTGTLGAAGWRGGLEPGEGEAAGR